jgi:phosphonate transport system substrate-binding protein
MLRPVSLASLLLVVSGVQAQSCTNRGELDALYCDVNKDLLADTPKATVSPAKIVLGISAVADATTARRTYGPLVDYLGACLKKEVELYPPAREGAVLEGQRNGTIHIAQYSTGGTLYGVNFAGAIPFAGKGRDLLGRHDSYTLKLLVRADSSARKPVDLKGKKIAHTSQSSNSGNLAPRALFPELGLVPDTDYKVEFSGAHDKSITGVKLGLYDAAAVASDVLNRMIAKGEIKANEFRVLYESESFPTEAFAVSSNLEPALQEKISKCFVEFKFPESMSNALEGNNRFFRLDYRKDWGVVRLIAKESGNPPTQANYQKVLLKK